MKYNNLLWDAVWRIHFDSGYFNWQDTEYDSIGKVIGLTEEMLMRFMNDIVRFEEEHALKMLIALEEKYDILKILQKERVDA